MNYWKINCMENHYPGLWQTWFLEQCAAIGWPPVEWPIDAPTDSSAWKAARKAVRQIKVKDRIIVQLQDHHIGRIGTVVAVRIEDAEWKSTVPKNKKLRQGEMGRRIEVKWDLRAGPRPISPSAMVKLPREAQFKGGTLRRTISRVSPEQAHRIEVATRNEENWTTLQASFASERAISDYIGAYPHRLEDGMRPYPNAKVREHVFADRTRTDVLLLDKENRLVVVECKQGSPTPANVNQLRGYLSKAKSLAPMIRGILVHGGAAKIREDVRK
ncbi:MAG TPA: hypothetical protein VGB94_11500, partial [Acidobacteriaceae bacterium]